MNLVNTITMTSLELVDQTFLDMMREPNKKFDCFEEVPIELRFKHFNEENKKRICFLLEACTSYINKMAVFDHPMDDMSTFVRATFLHRYILTECILDEKNKSALRFLNLYKDIIFYERITIEDNNLKDNNHSSEIAHFQWGFLSCAKNLRLNEDLHKALIYLNNGIDIWIN
jgi:hypothetical protein